MKFVHYLDKISNINLYALTSFGIFAFIFVVMLIYVFKTDKKTFQEISRIPLD